MNADERPGGTTLVWGIGVYIFAFAVFWGGISGRNAEQAVVALLALPLLLPALAASLCWTAFLIGTITGTPLVSFTYALWMAKRLWKLLLGWTLFAAVFGATMVFTLAPALN